MSASIPTLCLSQTGLRFVDNLVKIYGVDLFMGIMILSGTRYLWCASSLAGSPDFFRFNFWTFHAIEKYEGSDIHIK